MEIAVTGENVGFCTTTADTNWATLDCSGFKGEYLKLWATADMWFCFCATDSATPDVDATSPANQFVANMADELPSGNAGVHRAVVGAFPFLRYRAKTGTCELRVKPASRDGKIRSPWLL